MTSCMLKANGLPGDFVFAMGTTAILVTNPRKSPEKKKKKTLRIPGYSLENSKKP